MSPLLEVEDLWVEPPPHPPGSGPNGLSFRLDEGEALALIGEAGSGKTTACLAIVGLTRPAGREIHGQVSFAGERLAPASGQARRVRGNQIGVVPQPSPTALHPLISVGAQLMQAIRAHTEVSKLAAHDRAIDLLELTGVSEPHRAIELRPHQLSPVALRRAAIALAIANRPRLLIVDEPVEDPQRDEQAAIIELLAGLRERFGLTLLVATRHETVAARLADRRVTLEHPESAGDPA